MGIFSIIFINLWIREINVYGNHNLPKEYILSFLPQKKEIDSFKPKYYENVLIETGNFDYVLIDKSLGLSSNDKCLDFFNKKEN